VVLADCTIDAQGSPGTSVFSSIGYNSSNSQVGQKFVACADGSIASVSVYVSIAGGVPVDNIVVGLQADSSGVPSGTYLDSDSLSGLSLSGSSVQHEFSFSAPVDVANGMTYWVVVSRSGSNSTVNYYGVGGDTDDGTAYRIDGGVFDPPGRDMNISGTIVEGGGGGTEDSGSVATTTVDEIAGASDILFVGVSSFFIGLIGTVWMYFLVV